MSKSRKRLAMFTIAFALFGGLLATMPSVSASVADATPTMVPGDPAYMEITSFDTVVDKGGGGGNGTCRWDWTSYEVVAKNGIGVALIKYGAKVNACRLNGKITKVQWSTWHWENGCWCNTWNFVGQSLEDQSPQTLPRAYIWRQYRAHFRSCVTWLCKDKWPWVYVGARGDGTFGVNGGLS